MENKETKISGLQIVLFIGLIFATGFASATGLFYHPAQNIPVSQDDITFGTSTPTYSDIGFDNPCEDAAAKYFNVPESNIFVESSFYPDGTSTCFATTLTTIPLK